MRDLVEEVEQLAIALVHVADGTAAKQRSRR